MPMVERPITDIDVKRAWVISHPLNFTRYFFKEGGLRRFVVGEHHKRVCDALEKVLRGETKRLIINIAPRYGKTELAVKNFIAMGLAINPASKFIHLSYSADLAVDNSIGVKDIVTCQQYKELFPTRIRQGSDTKAQWDTEQGGGVYAVSTLGQITGFGAGALDELDDDGNELPYKFSGAIVIDDPIKPEDALSDTMRETVNRRFETTIRNRVNSRNTPIIIIMQRLHPHDLCGYLMETEPTQWEVLSLPCITTDDEGKECALWSFKHSLEELKELARINPFVFETQYMQNPRPLQGLMYETGFKEYDLIPPDRRKVRKCYIDTADTGSDYLCAIVYDETATANYIIDVLFTDKPMEYTETATAEMLTKYKVERCNVESNNGGRGFARNVEALCREMGNTKTSFVWFTQTKNKQVRIFTHSADVQNMTLMPRGWKSAFPLFASSILSYLKTGRNAHDDAPDALTGTFEKRGDSNRGRAAAYF